MIIQRITNLHSAPISVGLRAFVLAAETGKLLNLRLSSSQHARVSCTANIGNKLRTETANIFNGGNAYGIGITQGNSAKLRGSA